MLFLLPNWVDKDSKFAFSLIILLLEELSSLDLKVECHFTLEIGEPFGVASLKGAVLLLVRGQCLERGPTVALLMLLQVGHRVVPHEAAQEVQLEIVLSVESLATLSLQECVVVVFVALVCQGAQKLFLTLQSQFGQDALLKVHLHSLDSVLHLHDGLGLECPRGS